MMDNLGLALGFSFGAAIATVAANSYRTWILGTRSENPPVLRHITAYGLAYFAAFVAISVLPPPWSVPAVAAVTAPAFAVSVHGSEPLLTREYAEMAAAIFAVFIAFWLIYELLRLAGIDVLAT